jgi:hypothetical protein
MGVDGAGTKKSVIRLMREEGGGRPNPIRQRSAVRKLVIRLLPGINEHLRGEMRYRGDLSTMIIEAISTVDLKAVRLVDLSTETHIPTTTVALPKPIHAGLKSISKTRHTSMNVLVNTAVAYWLAGKNIIRLL